MATVIELTWTQFNELHAIMEAIKHAKAVGSDEGELKNTFVDGEQASESVKLTLDIQE